MKETRNQSIIFIKSYGVSLLLLIVALNQMRLVYTEGLSRWKGGGFGMYSEFHPHYNQVWISIQEGEFKNSRDSLFSRIPQDLFYQVRVFPNKNNLKKLYNSMKKYSDLEDFEVQVWRPYMDEQNSTFKRKLIIAYKNE